MKVRRQTLLLLLLFPREDLVTIPEIFDCNLYKCKDILQFSAHVAQFTKLRKRSLFMVILQADSLGRYHYTAVLDRSDG